jgi:hypothetical protein
MPGRALAEPAAGPPPQGLLGDAAAIQALDPLRGDRLLAWLPEMNAAADTGAIARLTRKLLPAPDAATAYSVQACAAAMRDLGLLAGSQRRHGINPFDPEHGTPALEPVLIYLGQRTDMVARDTVYHYTLFNPPGDRRRTYTGSHTELMLQDSVRHSIPALCAAVGHCQRLRQLALTDPEFAEEARQLAACASKFLAAWGIARQGADSVHFQLEERPYFEGFPVAGEALHGPAAADIPLRLVDLALWASDDPDGGEATRFLPEAARYTPQPFRRLYGEWAAGPSLATRMLQAPGTGAPQELAEAAAQPLTRTFKALWQFRRQHIFKAQQAYSPDIAQYLAGSAGGTLELLREYVDLTRKHHARLRHAASHA